MRLALALLALTAAWTGLVLGIDPVPTWFYVFAWYPTLVLLDELAGRIAGCPPHLRGWKRLLSLFGWSAVIWLVFEAANFRLANWYYVFLPAHPVERWAGVLLSFATVVPALVLMARLLDAIGGARQLRSAPLPLPPTHTWVPVALGGATLALALGWPQIFFPLIWGAVWLLLEPYVYRRRPDLSLFADLTRGEWERTARLLVAGFLVGVLWEFLNFWARGKWIYTVPWLEQLKLFEMPPIGFLGFPFFALEAWTMYAALVCLGAAVPVDLRAAKGVPRRPMEAEVLTLPGSSTEKPRRGRRWPLVAAVAFASAFAIATLRGMERWTISSTVPTLADLPSAGRFEPEVRAAGIGSPFALAATPADQLAGHPGITRERAIMLTETAKLVTLRGLGVHHAHRLRELGIFTQCRLAMADPPTLWSRYHGRPVVFDPPTRTPADRPTPAEVRVWVRSAAQACAREWRDEN